jgi:hypothetical protein
VADAQAWIYAAGGYYHPGKDWTGLVEEMKRYLGLGYSVVKMKIGGSPGCRCARRCCSTSSRIEAVLKLLDGKGRGSAWT